MNTARSCLVTLFTLLILTPPLFSQSADNVTASVSEPVADLRQPLALDAEGLMVDSRGVAVAVDSLVALRRFITTAIYEGKTKLTPALLRAKLQATPDLQKKYRFAKALKPVGPLIVLAGLGLGYSGIRGRQATKLVRGLRTPDNPDELDVQVEYTERSLPRVLGGLGLLIGGICLIELSNELTTTTVKLYNGKLRATKPLSEMINVNLGITSGGNVGLEAHF